MISSEEINFLVMRYFHECGFDHSFYTFNAESSIDQSSINGSQIPPGALITLLQKGLLYIQLEKEINSSHKTGQTFNSQLTLLDAALREGSALPQKQEEAPKSTTDSPSIQLDPSNSILLAEHSLDVLCCSWTPDGRFLATGSSDNTAIIWDLSNPASVSHCILEHAKNGPGAGPGIVQHQVSSLDWSCDSNFLVTGCSDGTTHIWDVNGVLHHEINNGQGTIHVVRFDPTGQRFVCGSSDSNVIITSTETGETIKKINVKHGSVLDASWRNEDCFAVGCDDGFVLIFDNTVNNGEAQVLGGHSGTINGLAWNSSGEYLASCSDDKTIRVWHCRNSNNNDSNNNDNANSNNNADTNNDNDNTENDSNNRTNNGNTIISDDIVLKGHGNPVYAVRWNIHDLLASASFDNTVRLWNIHTNQCTHVLNSHTMPIYSLCFTPDGEFIASGSVDQTIKFWKVSNGSLVCTCVGSQNIFDLQCDKEGQYIAACFEQGNVIVIPLSNLPLHTE